MLFRWADSVANGPALRGLSQLRRAAFTGACESASSQPVKRTGPRFGVVGVGESFFAADGSRASKDVAIVTRLLSSASSGATGRSALKSPKSVQSLGYKSRRG